MYKSQFKLLTQRKFLPLFITQFLGAFNDNMFKNALVVLITFYVGSQHGIAAETLVTISGGLLILPMVFFSATAGALADKFEKAQLIRVIKLAEIVLMALAGIGFYYQSIYFLMFVLFLMGTQSAFFGPLKYSILPTHLHEDELIGGNALIEIGTFLSILLGNAVAVLITGPGEKSIWAFLTVLGVAIVGYVASCAIPKAPASAPHIPVSWNIPKATYEIIQQTRAYRDVFLYIIGISWFWTIGFIYLSLFSHYTKDIIGADQKVFGLFLTVFSLGLALGSGLCNQLLKGRIEAIYVPIALLGLALFSLDLVWVSRNFPLVPSDTLLTLPLYLQSLEHWRVLFDLFMMSLCGGIYIVPLYVLIQVRSPNTHKSRVIACNNIVNSLMMCIGMVAVSTLLQLHVSIPMIIFILGLLNICMLFLLNQLMDINLIRTVLTVTSRFFFRLQVEGLEHLQAAGKRVLIVANHSSFLDGVFLTISIPRRLIYAIYDDYYKQWWMEYVLWVIDAYGLNPLKPMPVRSMIKDIRDRHRLCVIFPEGRVTSTGALMKIYQGPGMVAHYADACILPVCIEGAQHTQFSRLRDKIRTRFFGAVKLTFMPPQRLQAPPGIIGRARRTVLSEQLYSILTNTLHRSTNVRLPLFQSLLNAADLYGEDQTILTAYAPAPTQESLSYRSLIQKSLGVGRLLIQPTQKAPLSDQNPPPKNSKRKNKKPETFGIFLPNGVEWVISFFALQAFGQTAAILPMDLTAKQLLDACKLANVKRVISLFSWLEKPELQTQRQMLQTAGIEILDIRSLRAQAQSKAFSLKRLMTLWHYHRRTHPCPQNPAMVGFVLDHQQVIRAEVLSNENIQSNRSQIASVVDFNATDLFMNVLPLHHGLSFFTGLLVPLFCGIKTILYPNSRHQHIVSDLIYDLGVTVVIGGSDFLKQCVKVSHPYDFYRVRAVFSGGDPLEPSVHDAWSVRYGLRIFESHGLSAAAPLLTLNTPMHYQKNTVGRCLPGIEHRVASHPSQPQRGQWNIKMSDLQLGCYFPSQPGQLIPCEDWVIAATWVEIDEKGYVRLAGQKKSPPKSVHFSGSSLATAELALEPALPSP